MDAQRQVQECVLFEVEQAAQHLVHTTDRAWMLDGYHSDRVYLRLPCEGLGLPVEAIEVEYALSARPGQITFSVPSAVIDPTHLFHVFNLFNLLIQQLDLLLPRQAG